MRWMFLTCNKPSASTGDRMVGPTCFPSPFGILPLSLTVSNILVTNPNLNLTCLARDDNQRLIGVEYFSNSIKSATCSNSAVEITFADSPSYQNAKQSWDWLNQHDAHEVIVIITGNYPGCEGDDRTPYLAQTVAFDDGTLTATFSAVQKAWGDAIDIYELHLSSTGIFGPVTNNAQRLRPRDVNGSISLNHDFSNTNFYKTSVNGTDISLDCTTCGIQGSLDYDINISSVFLDLSGFVRLTPNHVAAFATLALSASADLTEELPFPNEPILQVPLGEAFDVGIVSVGPTLEVDAFGMVSALSAKLSASAGIRIDIPQKSIAQIGVGGYSSNFSGWTPQFSLIPPQLDASASLSATFGPRFIVSLNALFLESGLTAGLSLSAPELTLDASALANATGGVCGAADAYLGASFELDLAAELDAFAGVRIGETLPNTILIVSTATPLFSTCFTIQPGQAPTALPTLSSLAVVPIGPAASTSTKATTATEGSTSTAVPTSNIAPTSSPAPATGGTLMVQYFSDANCTDFVAVEQDVGINIQCQEIDVLPSSIIISEGCTFSFFVDSECADEVAAVNAQANQCIALGQITSSFLDTTYFSAQCSDFEIDVP